MPRKRYKIIDHTADVGLEVKGETIEQSFEEAAIGMFDIISHSSDIAELQNYEIDIHSDNMEELLIDFLNHLLYVYEVEGLVFSNFKLDIDEMGNGIQLYGKAMGELYNPNKHNYPVEIKAVTYHMLEVKRLPPYIRVIFDL